MHLAEANVLTHAKAAALSYLVASVYLILNQICNYSNKDNSSYQGLEAAVLTLSERQLGCGDGGPPDRNHPAGPGQAFFGFHSVGLQRGTKTLLNLAIWVRGGLSKELLLSLIWDFY